MSLRNLLFLSRLCIGVNYAIGSFAWLVHKSQSLCLLNDHPTVVGLTDAYLHSSAELFR